MKRAMPTHDSNRSYRVMKVCCSTMMRQSKTSKQLGIDRRRTQARFAIQKNEEIKR